MKKILLILFSALLLLPCNAQETTETKPRMSRLKGYVMAIRIEPNGDTTFFDQIDPVWIFPRGRKRRKDDWRDYYRLVLNFDKVYPYALVGRKLMAQVDSTIAAGGLVKSERNRYIKDVERELFRLFEKDIRKMTINQGVLLVRLVDRECGLSGYDIIKTYENGFAAGFWQMVAKLFSQDLKSRYEPDGKDAKTEQLVKIWDSGMWKQFYFSVFFEYPPEREILTDRLSTTVRQKTDRENSPARNQQ